MKKIFLFIFIFFITMVGVSCASLILVDDINSFETTPVVYEFKSGDSGNFNNKDFGDFSIHTVQSYVTVENTFDGYYGMDEYYLTNRHGSTNRIIFQFDDYISGFGADFGAVNDDFDVVLFNNNVLVSNFTISPTSNYTFYKGFYFDDNLFFDKVLLNFEYASLCGKDDILIDNITYIKTNPPAPVPEPNTLILFGSGLFGLAFLCRKNIVYNEC